mmetsp:Transcript_32849/g.75628  ORF Transcript_32849/g.75628 Transcript_32849/m.75628 type:complete len:105 (+) Transcript_32849:1199-1513(+)
MYCPCFAAVSVIACLALPASDAVLLTPVYICISGRLKFATPSPVAVWLAATTQFTTEDASMLSWWLCRDPHRPLPSRDQRKENAGRRRWNRQTSEFVTAENPVA